MQIDNKQVAIQILIGRALDATEKENISIATSSTWYVIPESTFHCHASLPVCVSILNRTKLQGRRPYGRGHSIFFRTWHTNDTRALSWGNLFNRMPKISSTTFYSQKIKNNAIIAICGTFPKKIWEMSQSESPYRTEFKPFYFREYSVNVQSFCDTWETHWRK